MIDYQNAAEDRRHLAGEIGEAIARFVKRHHRDEVTQLRQDLGVETTDQRR